MEPHQLAKSISTPDFRKAILSKLFDTNTKMKKTKRCIVCGNHAKF